MSKSIAAKQFKCTVSKCSHSFATERGRKRHMALSHRSEGTFQSTTEAIDALRRDNENLAWDNTNLAEKLQQSDEVNGKLIDERNQLLELVDALTNEVNTLRARNEELTNRLNEGSQEARNLMLRLIELQDDMLKRTFHDSEHSNN